MMSHLLARLIATAALLSWPGLAATQPLTRPGVLILAHGGTAQWNERVADVVRASDAVRPTEVAFGMASRPAIQAAVDALAARGVTDIVAVPLFVSSHSSVITSTEYLLGLRTEAPADLAVFARMSHGAHGTHAAPAADATPAADGTSPIVTRLPIRMTAAFNRHPLIGDVLADRARTISTDPAREAVILVAHGPVPDDDNEKWLADMAVLADYVRRVSPFGAVEALTVRDDAGPALRERTTVELRSRVTAHLAAGRRVLVVPHLMSYGGIEQGIRKRLEGLAYTMPNQGLIPDARIIEWVNASVAASGSR